MNYLISCSCGHTLEQHGIHDGCGRCACPRNRLAALDSVIDKIRTDSRASK
jgi:hypothetical protein